MSPAEMGDETRDGVLRSENAALAKLLERYRAQLLADVRRRLDSRLHARFDAADVLQEAYLDAARRLPEYAARPEVPFPVWLGFLVRQKVAELHRRHLGTQRRDAGREVRWQGARDCSESLAIDLAGSFTSPSQAAARAELQEKLLGALERLGPIDREVLRLRHFDELTNDEVAELLGLGRAAASNRYVRALRRLKAVATSIPSLREEVDPDV